MKPSRNLMLYPPSISLATLSLLCLLALGCAEEGGGSSGEPRLSNAQSLAELIESSGYDAATKSSLLTYDQDEHEFTRPPNGNSIPTIAWSGGSPFIGTYDTFDVAAYPVANGRKQYVRVAPGERKFAVYDIDPATGDRVAGTAQAFYGVKEASRVVSPDDPNRLDVVAMPILVLTEEIIYENGAPAYRANRVLEGELLAYDVAGGPTWDGVAGSLFSGQMSQLVVEAYVDGWKPFEGTEVVAPYSVYLDRR